MGETNNTFTVFRRQVVQTGKFEPAEASCSVTIALTGDESQEAVANLVAEWGTTLEIANYEALGVGYEMTESGVRRLEKSLPEHTATAPVAQPAEGNKAPAAPAIGGSGMDQLWRDLMDNQGNWWPPNWPKKVSGEFNPKSPDYKTKQRKGIWIRDQKGTYQIPDWFVCPFTQKTATELKAVTQTFPS